MFLGWSHSHPDRVRWLLSLASGGYTWSLVLNSNPIRPLAFLPTYVQARIDCVVSSSCFEGPMTKSSLGLFHISSKCPLSLSPRSPCLVKAQITAHQPSVCVSGLDTQSQFPFFPGPHMALSAASWPFLGLLIKVAVCLYVEELFSCMDQAGLWTHKDVPASAFLKPYTTTPRSQCIPEQSFFLSVGNIFIFLQLMTHGKGQGELKCIYSSKKKLIQSLTDKKGP